VKYLLRSSALALGFFAITATPIRAASQEAKTIPVRFPFRVDNRIMPAGEYLIEQMRGSDIATLIHTATGERIRIIRLTGDQSGGDLRLIFENRSNGYTLKSVW
jgi:hypothetical protein